MIGLAGYTPEPPVVVNITVFSFTVQDVEARFEDATLVHSKNKEVSIRGASSQYINNTCVQWS